jgi:hypothetical protein
MIASVRGDRSPSDPPGPRAIPQSGALPVAKKATVSKSKSAKRSTSTAKKPSPKSRKSTTRGASSKKTTPKKTPKKTPKTKASKEGDEVVTIDRRRKEDRRGEEPTKTSLPNLERREKVQRRRQIDPTTCERDYSVQEVDFMSAMDEYKRKSGRMFPTCSEVLEVIRDLGYVQLTPTELAARRGPEEQDASADTAPIAADSNDLEAVAVSEFEQG